MHTQKKYLKFLVIIFILVMVLPCAGFGASSGNPGEISASGTVRKQGITTYMYGTHVLIDANGKTLYALRSDSVELDKFVGRKVTVKGYPVKGYPVDFGPEYLEVQAIE